MNRLTHLLVALVTVLAVAGCGPSGHKSRAVFLLLDTSGTYTEELDKAQAIINYLLATLESGDSIAVARIDSESFSEKDIIAKATFDERPSVTNDQKRLFKQQMTQFARHLRSGSANTDITGGVIQAADFVKETRAQEKTILIFSDLQEDLPRGYIRDFPIQVEDIRIVALNVTKLRSDNIDPREYRTRLDRWQARVTEGGGQWLVVNDLDKIEKLITL